MARDANEVEMERQKSEMIKHGYSHKDINNPNTRAQFQNSGRSTNGSGSSGCFPAGTDVKTPDGWKKIESLKAGSVVLSYSKSGGLVQQKVRKQRIHHNCSVVTITRDHPDKVFSATEIHAVYTNRGWLRVNQLNVGDEIIYATDAGVLARHSVVAIEKKPRTETVYNLIVERNYNFVTKHCLAHSFSYFRRSRVAANEAWSMIIRALKLTQSTHPASSRRLGSPTL